MIPLLFLANKSFNLRKKKTEEEKTLNAFRKRVGEQEKKKEEKDIKIELCEIIMNCIKDFKASNFINKNF